VVTTVAQLSRMMKIHTRPLMSGIACSKESQGIANQSSDQLGALFSPSSSSNAFLHAYLTICSDHPTLNSESSPFHSTMSKSLQSDCTTRSIPTPHLSSLLVRSFISAVLCLLSHVHLSKYSPCVWNHMSGLKPNCSIVESAANLLPCRLVMANILCRTRGSDCTELW
ncbi:hypothetical protein JI435_152480, partial [Parastagonospora nodorum SN15]